MTDQPKTEWRDDEGRELRLMPDGVFVLFNDDVRSAYLSEANARFLLRYLPEALGEKRFVSGKQVHEHYIDGYDPADFDIQAADGDGPVGLTFDVERMKKMVELDAKIVMAAERYAACELPQASSAALWDVIEAVEAKRAAMVKS